MNYKSKKRLQIINYIFNNVGHNNGLPKEAIGKLFYLANKLFLLKYGCSITGDKFVAMQRGTTCSETLGILDRNNYAGDNDAVEYFKEHYYIDKNMATQTQYVFSKDNLENNFDSISDREKDILNIVINKFGSMKEDDISLYTHKFKEWNCFHGNTNKVCDISVNDIFDDETFWNDKDLSKYLDKENREIPKMIFYGEID